MKINFNTYNIQPNFKSAYTVNSVNINGEHYGNRQKEDIYDVAKALSDSMYHRTLSPDVQKKVDKLFPDFKNHPFVMVARSNTRNQRVNILTAYDAQKYKDVYRTNDIPEVKREIGQWTLSDILNRTGRKKIVISADEIGDNLIITDIERIR